MVRSRGPVTLAVKRRALKMPLLLLLLLLLFLLLLLLLDTPVASPTPPMPMPYRQSLGSGEGVVRVQRVQHGSGSIAKWLPPISLLLLPLLQFHVPIDAGAL